MWASFRGSKSGKQFSSPLWQNLIDDVEKTTTLSRNLIADYIEANHARDFTAFTQF